MIYEAGRCRLTAAVLFLFLVDFIFVLRVHFYHKLQKTIVNDCKNSYNIIEYTQIYSTFIKEERYEAEHYI